MKIARWIGPMLLATLYVAGGPADLALHHGLAGARSAAAADAHGDSGCPEHADAAEHDEDDCPCPEHHPGAARHHAGGHSCSFLSLAGHAVQAPLAAGDATRTRSASTPDLFLAWRLEPGRTATGLAPPA